MGKAASITLSNIYGYRLQPSAFIAGPPAVSVDLSGVDVAVNVGTFSPAWGAFVELGGVDIAVDVGIIDTQISVVANLSGVDLQLSAGRVLIDILKDRETAPTVSWFIEVDGLRYRLQSFALRYNESANDYLMVKIPFDPVLMDYLKDNQTFLVELKDSLSGVERVLWSGSGLEVDISQSPTAHEIKMSGSSDIRTTGNGGYAVRGVERYSSDANGLRVVVAPDQVFKPEEMIFLPHKPEVPYRVKRVTYNAEARNGRQKHFIEVLAA